jgi:hypothetical protein
MVVRKLLLKTQQAGKRLGGCCGDLKSVEINESSAISCSTERCIQVVNKSNLPIQTPLVVTYINRDGMYEYIYCACVRASLAPERLDGFYSYSVFKSLFFTSPCPVNTYIQLLKQVAFRMPQNTK